MLVGLGAAMGVGAAAEPLLGARAPRAACVRRRAAPRRTRPAARAPRAMPRSRP
ncbi:MULTISPECIES: hypothetical protein [Actinokineospora]|nr:MULTISPECIES: hypothetical protein [Actinokineospora]